MNGKIGKKKKKRKWEICMIFYFFEVYSFIGIKFYFYENVFFNILKKICYKFKIMER